MNKYRMQDHVGEGAYGDVFIGKDRETGETVAIKRFKSCEDEELAKRELKTAVMINSPYIVACYHGFRHNNLLHLVFEFCSGGTLLQLLDKNPQGLPPAEVCRYLYELSCAVSCCHSSNIIHRDIKPENCMIHNNRLKLCDFGCARVMPMDGVPLTDYVATRWYRPPELELRSRIYDFSVDCWSIGCIFGELIDGMPVFAGETTVDQLHLIQQTLGVLPKYPGTTKGVRSNVQHDYTKPKRTFEQRYRKKLSSEGLDMISSLLSLDPKARLTADQCLKHKYFSNLEEVVKKNVARNSTRIDDEIAEEVPDDDEVAEEIEDSSDEVDVMTALHTERHHSQSVAEPVPNDDDYADDFEEEVEPQAQAATAASPYDDDFEEEVAPQAQAATAAAPPTANENKLPRLPSAEKDRVPTDAVGRRDLPAAEQRVERQDVKEHAADIPQCASPRVESSSANRAEKQSGSPSLPPVQQTRAERKRSPDKRVSHKPSNAEHAAEKASIKSQAQPGERRTRRTRKAGLQRRTQLGERTKKKHLKKASVNRDSNTNAPAAVSVDENGHPKQKQKKKKGKKKKRKKQMVAMPPI
jgi:cyclin-dependent kinase-like